jgi:hypothetical protein
MRTTTAEKWGFNFTITDLGKFLGKSPVTLRGWDKSGFINIPREGTDRKLALHDIREIAIVARKSRRISNTRFNIVNAAITLLELIEQENSK